MLGRQHHFWPTIKPFSQIRNKSLRKKFRQIGKTIVFRRQFSQDRINGHNGLVVDAQLLRHEELVATRNRHGANQQFSRERARICRDAVDSLRQSFGDVCFDPIHFAIKAKEAPAQGKTLFEYAPGSPAAEDYARVVQRLLELDFTMPERQKAGGIS